MSNDDLKKKFIKIIRQGFADADCRRPYTNVPYPYFDSQIFCIADALIAAGIGDVKEAERKAFVYSEEIAHLDKKLKDAEHRAEVAERALKDICTNIAKDSGEDIDIEPYIPF